MVVNELGSSLFAVGVSTPVFTGAGFVMRPGDFRSVFRT